MDRKSERQIRREVAERAKQLILDNDGVAESCTAWEVKPGLFRVDVETPQGQANRVGLFTRDSDGNVSPVS